MFNTTIKRITGLLAAFVIVAIIASAKGADYVKKATWHESMIASRQALVANRPPSLAPAGLPNLTKDIYTIAAWVRTRSDGVIFAECGDQWSIYAKCFRIEGGTFRMDINCGGVVSGRSRVSDGQWHHVVLVRTGPAQRIYIDGVDEATGNLQEAPVRQAIQVSVLPLLHRLHRRVPQVRGQPVRAGPRERSGDRTLLRNE